MAEYKPLLISSRKPYLATVAIDFGTTFSGFAFSFNKKSDSKDAIYINKDWGIEQGCRTPKAPTCLLLKPDKSFDSFGYEAMEKYACELKDDPQQQKYYYFERFKMKLHSDEKLNKKTMLQASNGRRLKALDVFAHSIRYLKNTAVQLIRDTTGRDGYTSEDIQWVLTVPAIWSPAAKQFMREAAYKAGVATDDDPKQLTIALEPEAASLFCRDEKLSEFAVDRESQSQSSTTNTLAEPGTHYMVVDIGGGTLDVTVHEVEFGGSVKEVHHVTGGPYGGTKVDEEFKKLLMKIFTAQKVQDLQKRYPGEWLALMNDFEMKKRSNRPEMGKTTRIHLPRRFVSLLLEEDTDLDSLITARYKPSDVKIDDDDNLCLGSEVVKKLFQPVLSGIVKHLKGLLSNRKLSGVTLFLLVGGFADSALLQAEIKKEFSSKYRVMVPQDANIAVVKGAVMYGKQPHKITARVMSVTYGAGCSREFVKGVHLESKKFYDDENVAHCNNLFNLYVTEGQTINVGQKVTKTYTPLYATDDTFNYGFYTSDDRNVTYVTEDGVKKMGTVVVKSPDVYKGKNRKIEVSMYFGGTEITASARDLSSGNIGKVNLEFLYKN